MKKLIVLGGNSPRNQGWGEEVIQQFGNLFDATYLQLYEHWENGGESIDFTAESEKLRDVVASADSETKYYIYAKSFGTILSFLSIHKGYIAPEKCVLFGIPLNLVEKQDLWGGDWSPVSDFKVPTLVFLNDNDPVASHDYTQTKIEVLGVSNIQIISIPKDDHSYVEFEDYKEKIKEFLKE